jgi:4-hydroxybenzoate polyprenyltransferase
VVPSSLAAPIATETLVRDHAVSRRARPLWHAVLVEARPKQWIKNGILFAAIVFAKHLTEQSALRDVGLAFLLFCMVASGVYYCNDLVDRAADRLHPRKRFRPIAAGEIPLPIAWAIGVGSLVVALPLAFALRPMFGVTVAGYIVLQVLYTFWLKHEVILDVFGIAGSFVLRALAGAVVIAAPISPWLYVCTALLALCLGFAKRRHELLLLEGGAGSHRKALDGYSLSLLDAIIGVVTSATVMAYALYTFNAENLPANHAMMFTIPFVLYAIFRYLYLVFRKGEGGSPEDMLLADRPLLVCILLWGVASLAILSLA